MNLAMEFKNRYHCSLEHAFKNALFEKIANDFDQYVSQVIYQETLKKYPLLTRKEIENLE